MTDMDLAPLRDPRPLAVQVYDQLYDAFAGAERAGREVPTEVDLSRSLGVSRTTVRQALALLEEDGVLQRGKGRRRFVASPVTASEPNAPLERMLVADAPVTVRRHRLDATPATRWGSTLLQVAHEEPLITCESTLWLDDVCVATALELVPADIAHLGSTVRDATLLAELGVPFRSRATLTYSRLSAYGEHSRERDTDDDLAPAVVLTQVLAEKGRPVYLSKHIVSIERVTLSLLG